MRLNKDFADAHRDNLQRGLNIIKERLSNFGQSLVVCLCWNTCSKQPRTECVSVYRRLHEERWFSQTHSRLFSLRWVRSYTMHREVCKCDRWCVRAAAQDIVPVVRMGDKLNSSVIKANRPHGPVRIT